ncbi:MAG: Gfo/Idh/MocA family oxidoreductase [Ruminococcaceae bacterium]|nr:Gfo/Idh/MocA family oxidoreductase [Oscillospiraceae bacterium]
MKSYTFGIIGCGLMGREFASAASRWCHFTADVPRPEIVAVCDVNPANTVWFERNVPGLRQVYSDYRQLLADPEISVVYIAVPHILHQEIFIEAIKAGKHIMGEKPFGMDQAQNKAIMQALTDHPQVFARCSSEFPFFPAMQLLIRWIRENRFGRILEIKAGFCHSSDMDVNKTINWKRQAAVNGAYGCLGDLGIHTEHVPFRMGFKPRSVYARLDKFITERPDGKGGMAACDTWDNGTMICETEDPDGHPFTMYLETKRMAPGQTNTWYFEIYGMKASARFSSTRPNQFSYTVDWGKEQAWADLDIGYKPMIPVITGPIFEFGFTDAILQMWGTFMLELDGQQVDFGCFTPEETVLSHDLQTASLRSHATRSAIDL